MVPNQSSTDLLHAGAGDCGNGGIVAIDAHAHVFTCGLPLVGDRRYAPSYDAPATAYFSMLERNGMSHGVLVQPSFLGTDNHYLLAALQQAPDRLRGVVVVPPGTSFDELEALDAVGVIGIRLNLLERPDPDFRSELWKRHFSRVASLGWQIEVQAEARRLPSLLPALLEIGVPVVVDHFGRPDPHLGIDDPGFRFLLEAGATGQIWVKLSGGYRVGDDRLAVVAAAALRDALGPHRLLWGSDWPHTQFEARANPLTTRRALDLWVPDPAEQRLILADTPAQLFGFDRSSQRYQQAGTA